MQRPKNWESMNEQQRMKWLRDQRHEYKGGRRNKLTEKDQERVWTLVRNLENKSLVAEMLQVSRRTLYRFLDQYPIPETFEIETNVESYDEIKIWMKRQRGFSGEDVISGYLGHIQQFHDYQKEKHPNKVRPKLWDSDDILEFVQTFQPYQQHNVITALRQLSLKAPKQFPFIDIGLLPTKRTHKAKRSLAGKPQYYLSAQQIRAMIDNVPKPTPEIEARNKAIISTLFNIMCRMGSIKKDEGLLSIHIEKLHFKTHSLIMKDKGNITWHVRGLTDQTSGYISKYLNLRGNPSSGLLFVTENGKPMKATQVNKMLKQAGHNAGIQSYDKKTGKGKMLTSKSFRKSAVKYALDDCGINPVSLIGSGKNVKTCLVVGWSEMKVLMEHYAPHLEKQINEDRQKFIF